MMKKKKNHPNPLQKTSTRVHWLLWFYKKENAQKFLFETNSMPCTLDFYIFKLPLSSHYTATPVKTHKKFSQRNLLFANIVTVILISTLFLACFKFGTDKLVERSFTRLESLELGGRIAKAAGLEWFYEKSSSQQDASEKTQFIDGKTFLTITLSFMNEICADTPERPLCQKRNKVQKTLENLPAATPSAPDSGS
jgi:hypothetical protein